jgi:hypothetical protein
VHEDEEIEVEVELADILFEYLVTDVSECLLAISEKRKQKPLPVSM